MIEEKKYLKMKRGPQIITLKDASIITGYSLLGSGDKVLECGSGSGFMTVFLANIVGEKGLVVSIEQKPEFLEIAQHNIEKQGFTNTEFINTSFELLEETRKFNLIVLDFKASGTQVPKAYALIEDNGVLVGYTTNSDQVKEFHLNARAAGFKKIRTVESIIRDYKVEDYGIRPENVGIQHTGYITICYKLKKEFT